MVSWTAHTHTPKILSLVLRSLCHKIACGSLTISAEEKPSEVTSARSCMLCGVHVTYAYSSAFITKEANSTHDEKIFMRREYGVCIRVASLQRTFFNSNSCGQFPVANKKKNNNADCDDSVIN